MDNHIAILANCSLTISGLTKTNLDRIPLNSIKNDLENQLTNLADAILYNYGIDNEEMNSFMIEDFELQ